jgi:hypothetical protein
VSTTVARREVDGVLHRGATCPSGGAPKLTLIIDSVRHWVKPGLLSVLLSGSTETSSTTPPTLSSPTIRYLRRAVPARRRVGRELVFVTLLGERKRVLVHPVLDVPGETRDAGVVGGCFARGHREQRPSGGAQRPVTGAAASSLGDQPPPGCARSACRRWRISSAAPRSMRARPVL